MEIEAKFSPVPPHDWASLPGLLRTLGARTESAGEVLSTDLYVDSDQWIVWRGGYALRERREREGEAGVERVILTLKGLRGSRHHLSRREELELEGWELQQLLTTPGPGDPAAAIFRQRLEGLARGAQLVPRFGLVQRRKRLWIRLGELLVEASCDRVQLPGPGSAGSLQEDTISVSSAQPRLDLVEFELKSQSERSFAQFCKDLQQLTGWKPCPQSKFQWALSHSGLTAPT